MNHLHLLVVGAAYFACAVWRYVRERRVEWTEAILGAVYVLAWFLIVVGD